jgi:hypothetical protein
MSYKILPAMTLEFKTGTIIMPLIEEKKGFSYPNKRCVRCANVAPVARNVSRHGRNETATLATSLYIRPGPWYRK